MNVVVVVVDLAHFVRVPRKPAEQFVTVGEPLEELVAGA